jgi:pimeloyl-ACP methyl ester carboxylesterase
VLEDPPWFTIPGGGQRPPQPETLQQSVRPFRDDLEAAIASGRVELPLWPEIELQPWAVSKTQLDLSLTDREQIVRQAPWIDVAAAIARPTLLVTGDREEAIIVNAESRKRLAELGNRHIEVAVVPGAGHTVRRDCADSYHQIVDPWIKEIFRGAAAS